MRLFGILYSCLPLALLGLVAGCATPAGNTTPDPSVLRVGITPNSPPLISKEKGKPVGLEADAARLLAQRLGRQVKFVELDWEEQIPALTGGRIDIIMSGMSITPMRQALVSFTKPYVRGGQLLLVPTSERRMYLRPQVIVFSTDRIGVEKGTTGHLFVQRQCPKAKAVTFRSVGDAVKSLVKGKVDVVLHDAFSVWLAAAEHETTGITPVLPLLTSEVVAWSVRKSDGALLAAVNAVRAEWIADGTLNRLLDIWIPYHAQYGLSFTE